jgi:hypothetical protein
VLFEPAHSILIPPCLPPPSTSNPHDRAIAANHSSFMVARFGFGTDALWNMSPTSPQSWS